MRKSIVAISGSTRRNSSNGAILRCIADAYSDQLNVHIFDDLDQLPHFNPDLTDHHVPLPIQHFRTLIEQADGVLFCTPEYVFSLPGALKNAIEWMVSTTIFSNKPTAMIVASAHGKKAMESLDLVLTTIEANMSEGSKLLIQGARGKVGESGQLKDKETEEQIFKVVNCLMELMEVQKV